MLELEIHFKCCILFIGILYYCIDCYNKKCLGTILVNDTEYSANNMFPFLYRVSEKFVTEIYVAWCELKKLNQSENSRW